MIQGVDPHLFCYDLFEGYIFVNAQGVYLVSTSYRDLVSLVLLYKAILFSFYSYMWFTVHSIALFQGQHVFLTVKSTYIFGLSILISSLSDCYFG